MYHAMIGNIDLLVPNFASLFAQIFLSGLGFCGGRLVEFVERGGE